MVGFCDFVGVDIAPVSKKTAVKEKQIGSVIPRHPKLVVTVSQSQSPDRVRENASLKNSDSSQLM